MLTQAQQQLQVAFNRQIEWCTQLGSPFMVRLLAVSRDLLIVDAALAEQFLALVPDPGPGLLALRFTGALHALALQGHEPWASLWPSTAPAGTHATDAALLHAVRLAVTSQWPHIKATLRSAPQTNEVRRSAVLLPGWLHVAQHTGLPLALVEIGASAGLNLWADKWLHEHGTWTWPGDSDVRITSEWRGPPPAHSSQPATQPSILHIASRRACDILPIDITQITQRQRLASYVWPDQTERLQLLGAALSKAANWASLSGVHIEAADAASYLQRELHTLPVGQTTLVFHSIVWQYLTGPERQRLQAVITAAGARATATSPLAWLTYEFSAADQPAQLRCRIWPSVQPSVQPGTPPGTQPSTLPEGDEQLLAHAHPHGAWVEWVAGTPGSR